MKYQMKWIEEKLGITRKAIINLEKVGLIKKSPNYLGVDREKKQIFSKEHNYRSYDEDEIKQIWAIRVLQGIGYTLKEIQKVSIDELTSEEAITNKIIDLEKAKVKIENVIGYAKMIKMTGIMPGIPEDINETKPSEYTEKALVDWNINNEELFQKGYKLISILLGQEEIKTPNDLDDALNVFESMVTRFQEYPESLSISQFYIEIVKRINNGYDNAEVQLLIQMIYNNMKVMAERDGQELTKILFTKATIPLFLYGDFRVMNAKKYGDDGCDFIANAIAYYVGYKDFESMKGILI